MDRERRDHLFQVAVRKVLSVQHVDRDRDHAQREQAPAGQRQLLLLFLFFQHGLARLLHAGNRQVPKDLGIHDRLVGVFILHRQNPAGDRHADGPKEQGRDGLELLRALFAGVDRCHRVFRPARDTLAVDRHRRGCQQHAQQHAQHRLHDQISLFLCHCVPPSTRKNCMLLMIVYRLSLSINSRVTVVNAAKIRAKPIRFSQ